MATKRKWSELSPGQQRAIVVAGAIETALTIYSLFDLRRRDASEVRGPKRGWVPLLFVQPFGPLAYLVWGRRRPELSS